MTTLKSSEGGMFKNKSPTWESNKIESRCQGQVHKKKGRKNRRKKEKREKGKEKKY